MSIRSALGLVAPIALAVTMAGGFATTAHANLPKSCSGAFCAENSRIVEGGSHVIRFSFRGSNVNHYNVRFVEQGGRTVQKEISTFSGSNLSKWWRVRGRNGQQVTVQVQACSRGGVFSSSKCTGWTTITLTLL